MHIFCKINAWDITAQNIQIIQTNGLKFRTVYDFRYFECFECNFQMEYIQIYKYFELSKFKLRRADYNLTIIWKCMMRKTSEILGTKHEKIYDFALFFLEKYCFPIVNDNKRNLYFLCTITWLIIKRASL